MKRSACKSGGGSDTSISQTSFLPSRVTWLSHGQLVSPGEYCRKESQWLYWRPDNIHSLFLTSTAPWKEVLARQDLPFLNPTSSVPSLLSCCHRKEIPILLLLEINSFWGWKEEHLCQIPCVPSPLCRGGRAGTPSTSSLPTDSIARLHLLNIHGHDFPWLNHQRDATSSLIGREERGKQMIMLGLVFLTAWMTCFTW